MKNILIVSFISLFTLIPLRWCYSEHVKVHKSCEEKGGKILKQRTISSEGTRRVCLKKEIFLVD